MVLYSNQYYYSWVQAGEETSLDRHVRQRLATMVLTALVIFSINTFSPVGNGDGFGTTIIQARKEIRQLPDLLDQQIAILAGLGISPDWVREQGAADSLIYGIVRPDDMVPTGINKNYSYLVANNRDKEIFLFFKADKKKVTIKCASHGERLYTKTVPLSRLVEQSYRTKKQRQRVNGYASAPRTE